MAMTRARAREEVSRTESVSERTARCSRRFTVAEGRFAWDGHRGSCGENADAMSRVVQGVIQGVTAGSIGAGVSSSTALRRTVDGLTTAATVWVSAPALDALLGHG